jgi:hypothetical protein
MSRQVGSVYFIFGLLKLRQKSAPEDLCFDLCLSLLGDLRIGSGKFAEFLYIWQLHRLKFLL